MAIISTTPPSLQGPTAKEKKYDRQLRLWAAAGQQALEEAHVLLLNDGPGVVGIEALKNLVLPGVGSFTIVDDREVDLEDLGVNFFLSEEGLGKSRAQETCRYLRELNPEVQGHSIIQSPTHFIQSKNDLKQYTLILIVGPTRTQRNGVASSLPTSHTPISTTHTLSTLAYYAWEQSIPLFHVHSIGFYSQFSLQLPAHFPIVDTHPDPVSTQDLRLLNPWMELADFAKVKTADLDNLSDHEHGHIPYLLILLHYLEEWKSTHDGKPPENYKEKTAFKDIVWKGMRTENAEGGEENFEEAIGAIIKSLNPASISGGLREVFETEECTNLDSDSANFWLIAHAIRDFHKNQNVLPLSGALPDMKSQSSDYITLQNIYKTKARKDLAEVLSQVRSLETQLSRKSPIDEKEVEAFCKGAAFVKLIRGRRLPLAIEPGVMSLSDRSAYLIQQLEDETSLIPIFLSILARDFGIAIETATEGGELPPEPADREAWVTSTMDQYIARFLEQLESSGTRLDCDVVKSRHRRIIQELVRANGAELHNISALTGGMVAQEAIKVITKQYVPADNICVFDGITSKVGVLKL